LKQLFSLGLLFILTGCYLSPSPASSGVEGQVLIGPMCPVMKVGDPCPDRPYQANLTVLRTTGERVSSFQTGTDGSFHQPLAPGEYILHPDSPGGMSHAPEQVFFVRSNQYTWLTVTYDSGLR
jgi:hypothetical protein